MRKLLLTITIIFIFFMAPAFAETAFYQSIINASYLSDFAYNSFPLSLWADFGLSGITFMEGLSTKLYVRVEAGISQRTLKQYPYSGDIIDVGDFDSLSYALAFSDGSAVFEQGVLPDPDVPGRDMLSITVALRMRWEQAFATFRDIRDGNYAGIFGNPLLFPEGSTSFVGAPELSGDKYFLSNSFSFLVSLNRYRSNYLVSSGYGANVSIVFAPFWLINDVSVFEGAKTDAYRLRVDGGYDYTILDRKTYSGKNLYSLYLTTSASATFLFGKSIPRYLQDKSFMGKSIVPRLFYGDIYAKLQFNGPEYISLGTYPSLYVYMQNGLNAGNLINSNTSEMETEFFGGFGFGFQMTVIGSLKAFVEYSYIYTPIFGETTGGNFSYGCQLSLLF